jgi:hypothetical protein
MNDLTTPDLHAANRSRSARRPISTAMDLTTLTASYSTLYSCILAHTNYSTLSRLASVDRCPHDFICGEFGGFHGTWMQTQATFASLGKHWQERDGWLAVQSVFARRKQIYGWVSFLQASIGANTYEQ